MGEKPTLVEQLRATRERENELRAQLKEHPEELESAKKELANIDKKIETAKKKVTDLETERKEFADIISLLTGGRVGERKRAPSGRGKSKLAIELMRRKGIGGFLTGRDVAEATGMLGGAPGAWLRRMLDAGYLKQEEPRMPYEIVDIPPEE